MLKNLFASLFAQKGKQLRDGSDANKSKDLADALGEFAADPRRGMLKYEDRVQLAQNILKDRTSMSDAEIRSRARSFEARLTSMLEQNKIEAMSDPSISIEASGISHELLLKAIRLFVLDPSKDLETSLPALVDLNKLSEDKFEGFNEYEREVARVWVTENGYDELRSEISRIELCPITATFRDVRRPPET